VLGLGLVVITCGGPSRPATITVGTDAVATSDLVNAAAGLCRAKTQAATDPQAARVTFFDRSHQAIHTIARALEAVDRPLAARLLEAKQTVEADFTADTPAAKLTDDLTRLAETTRVGLQRLRLDAPGCGT
jgi:hypothetical protein